MSDYCRMIKVQKSEYVKHIESSFKLFGPEYYTSQILNCRRRKKL